MRIERKGNTPIIKKEIDLSNLETFSQERIDAVTPLLKEIIEECPISTFGLITHLRKNFYKSLCETVNNSHFDYWNYNFNCFSMASIMKKKLEKENIKGFLMTYQANKFALTTGDAKMKEAHISVIYPTIKDEKILYTIFDPGLKIDKPLIFFQNQDARNITVNENQIDIGYEPLNFDYPYFMNMVGQNMYSYNKTNHTIFQRFNPKYETINIGEMLFPICYKLLTGYKAIIYSTDPQKRAYITLNHLEQKLHFCDCITGIEYHYSYNEIEKMGYKQLKEKISVICHKLQLDPEDITSNIFFMIYYHDEYMNYVMDQDVLNEYYTKHNIKRLTRQ